VTFASPATATTSACESLAAPTVPGARVVSLTGVAHPDGHTVPAGPFNPDPDPRMPTFCKLTLVLTHPGANDRVKVSVWSPEHTWNGRFQGTGGGGFAAGFVLVRLLNGRQARPAWVAIEVMAQP
jgi:hypothetical protein